MAEDRDDPPGAPPPPEDATQLEGRARSLAELEAMTAGPPGAPPPDRTAFGQPAFVPLPDPTPDGPTVFASPLPVAETAFAAPRPPLPGEPTVHQATPTGAPTVDGPTAFAGPLAQAPTAFAHRPSPQPGPPAVAATVPLAPPPEPLAARSAPAVTPQTPGRGGSLLLVVAVASALGFLVGALLALLSA